MSEHVNVLDKQIVLRLNSRWIAIGYMTVREAVVFLASENGGQKPGYAMDYETIVDEQTGQSTLSFATPVAWDEWITKEVREQDLSIATARGLIRAPLVVICSSYSKIPTRTTRWSTGNVHKRDGYTCAYTLRKLSHAEATVDHILPRSRGGKDDWLNTVTCDRKVNTAKADRTPSEAGLVLQRKPKAPKPMAVVFTTEDAKHVSQKPFLI